MSFRWKLFISYFVLTCLLTAVFYLYANRFLENRLLEESRQGLYSHARILNVLLARQEAGQNLQLLAEQVGAGSRARVTLISMDGHVHGDSGISATQLPTLENHRMRPEVQKAVLYGSGEALRYSETLRTTMLYVALKSSIGSGDGIIRLALPLTHLDSAKAALHKTLAIAAIVIMILGLVSSILLSNLVSKPFRVMADMASRFGVGERGLRLPVTHDDEAGYLARVLNEMAERIEQQMIVLEDEKQRLDAILRGIGEGLVLLDSSGNIKLANQAFCRFFDLDSNPEERLLIEICRHPVIQETCNQALADGLERTSEFSLESGKTLLSHWVPLITSREARGVVAVFLDITERKRLETVRRDFIANVSHELRTPVAVIKGYTETIQDQRLIESDPAQAFRFVDKIGDHSQRLARLLEDILALSRLESSPPSLTLAPVMLEPLVQKIVKLFEHAVSARDISVDVSVAPELAVQADNDRLEQVLVNLLDNAIKYSTPGGSVRITAITDNGLVTIQVADSGIGIPEKDLPRIFERFYRADAARSREMGGTGLGLAIAKHIVQLHGGTITVQSTIGKGSLFSFCLKAA